MRRRIPLHRRAAAVAADADARHVLLEGIAHLIGRDRDLVHADLVAVIERRRAAQGQQQHRGDARLLAPDAARDPRTIVIAEHPVRPGARRQRRFVVGDDLLDRARVPQRRQQREIERQLRAGRDRCRNRRPGARAADRSRRSARGRRIRRSRGASPRSPRAPRADRWNSASESSRAAAGPRDNADWADCRETARP